MDVRRSLRLAALVVLASVGCEGDEGGASGAGGAMSSGGTNAGGAGGASGGSGGSSGGSSGSSGGSGGSSGGSGGSSGGTGGADGTSGGSGGTSGTDGALPDPCEEALLIGDACPVCEDDEGCDAPTYTVNGDGTVTSSCCGLVFQQACDRMMTYTWFEAVAYCESLELAGGGWRLPEKDELFTLAVDAEPSLDPVAFPDEPLNGYWTNTASNYIAGFRWTIAFWPGGPAFAEEKDETFPNYDVRCVR